MKATIVLTGVAKQQAYEMYLKMRAMYEELGAKSQKGTE